MHRRHQCRFVLFRRDTRAGDYQAYLTGTVPLISFMTVAELDRWVLQRNWSNSRREHLATFLDRFTIVLVDRSLCRVWARVSDQARRKERPIQAADAWIAATAVALGVPLITNNRDDFLGVDDLRILPTVPA